MCTVLFCAIEKNAGNPTYTSRNVGLEVNSESLILFTFGHRSAGKNCNMRITNISIENVAEFKYFETTVSHHIYTLERKQEHINFAESYHASPNFFVSPYSV
jgi:hypothetical protein